MLSGGGGRNRTAVQQAINDSGFPQASQPAYNNSSVQKLLQKAIYCIFSTFKTVARLSCYRMLYIN